MRYFQCVGLALLTTLTLGIAMSTTATAALPEFLPTKTVKTEGTFGTTVLEVLGGSLVVKCTNGNSVGEVTSEKTISKGLITFEGCLFSGFNCQTKGAPAGVIVTKELTGTLGYINKANKEVGILFKPTTGKELIEFECLGTMIKAKVLGLVICPITKVNGDTKEFTLKCEQEKGDQKPTKFEGGSTEILLVSINNNEETDWGLLATAIITTAVLSEIMA